ncbi:hypothetical protein LguiB_019904 [Lonicera macranthoides]
MGILSLSLDPLQPQVCICSFSRAVLSIYSLSSHLSLQKWNRSFSSIGNRDEGNNAKNESESLFHRLRSSYPFVSFLLRLSMVN